jgi:hypothetical protein
MSETLAGDALRVQRDRDYRGKPQKYQHTYRIIPEGKDEPLFCGDVIGRVTSDAVVFLDSTGRTSFSMRPNRRIMPTYWSVTDASDKDIGRIVQMILKKGLWAGFDASGGEMFRIVSAESEAVKVGDLLFGGSPSKYGIVQGDVLVASLRQEPRAKATKSGLRGFFQGLMIPHDWVIRFGPEAPDVDIRLILPALLLLIDFTIPTDSSG